MSRLPELSKDALTTAQQALFEEIARGPRGGARALEGPFGVWMRSPAFGQEAQRLGAHVRYRTSLPPRLSELAILVCARHWRAQYEWFAHAPIAVRAGVPPAAIEALRRRAQPDFPDPGDRIVHDFCSALLTTTRVADDDYAAAVGLVGEVGVVELVGLVGYYTMVALTLNAFEVAIPPGEPLPFD